MEQAMDRGPEHPTGTLRPWAMDTRTAVMAAEACVVDHLLTTFTDDPAPRDQNAFGERVAFERDANIGSLARRAAVLGSDGKRVALVAPLRDLACARTDLETIAAQRLGIVAHAFARPSEDDLFALADIGWGVLVASGVQDSVDLSLVARRAAEDAGAPFLVLHSMPPVRVTEPVASPTVELCESYLGRPARRLRRRSDASHPFHAAVSARAFAERVPFALGSALRELEAHTGRRHDVLERTTGGEHSLMLIGVGDVGDSLAAEVDRLTSAGHDVGAVRLTALRPLPGPRLVKSMARALAVTVVEGVDVPLSPSNPLAREVKSAFADALTWVPDYPGIGRIPRIVTGVIARPSQSTDVDAIVENMAHGERGRRSFVLGRDASHDLPRATSPFVSTASLSFRGSARDAEGAHLAADLAASLVAVLLGLRVRATVREGEEGGFDFDVVAAKDRVRGYHAPHALRVVALGTTDAFARGNPVAHVAHRGVIAVASRHVNADALWGDVPPYARALAHDRGARLIGFPPAEEGSGASPWLLAAAYGALAAAGATPEGRSHVGAAALAKEVYALVVSRLGPKGEGTATQAAEVARRTLEGLVEVPAAVVGRDDDVVHLGRRDARIHLNHR